MPIRNALPQDAAALLEMMRDLARYERYIDQFAVDEATLLAQGLASERPDFECLVEEMDGVLLGYAVCYRIAFTFRARPTAVLKELYVSPQARGRGIGERLFLACARAAAAQGSAAFKWQVAPWNAAGMRFYERLGARRNDDWIDYELPADAFARIARSCER